VHTALGSGDIARYREQGYLVLHALLTPDELAELSAAIEQTVQRFGRTRVFGNPELDEPEHSAHRVVLQRLNLWKADPVVRRYLLDPSLGQMLCELEGIDGLRVFHDQTFWKPPFGQPTAFHLDMPNWSFYSAHGVQIWIALDPATRDNGCLHYLPGSHRHTSPDRTVSISDDVGALFALYPELASSRPRAVEVAAGGAIVHNGLTVHGAGANMTERWRRAMTCQYMPDGATFNGRRSIFSREQLAKLAIGDRLDDDIHHPIVFRRGT
jgi:phytanoyl-CoA hydroxylase